MPRLGQQCAPLMLRGIPLCALSPISSSTRLFIYVSGSHSRSISLAAEITVAQEVFGYELRCDVPSQIAATRYRVVRKLSPRYLYYIWGIVLLRYGNYALLCEWAKNTAPGIYPSRLSCLNPISPSLFRPRP